MNRFTSWRLDYSWLETQKYALDILYVRFVTAYSLLACDRDLLTAAARRSI